MVLAISQDNMMSWVALVQALSKSVRIPGMCVCDATVVLVRTLACAEL